jgi:hypothetical protein
MQKELNIDSLPPAIVYEPKGSSGDYRPRSGSIQSNTTAEEAEPMDPDIARALQELEMADSPTISLRKKLSG